MSEQDNMINLTIDGQKVTVPKGTTVYAAAKQLGIDIPIFCYQDRMPPFGACRMCLVEVEKMPKLQTSCSLEAKEGMVVKTQSTKSVEGRKDIIEFLLINHPLDCPICDKGGECPLQENALACGPGKSRFFEEKRHFTKPYSLGPVLMLDRERCIVCARCTRFGELIAGDHALEMIDRGYKTEVGTPDGGPAKSKFIGNTISICPVGALTSKVYRFRARPWDNHPTPSTCTLCPVGCSLILDSRDGEIMRTRVQENKDVNDIWLCDKGWFGYEFNSHPDRLQKPLIRRNGRLEPTTWDEALSTIASKIQNAKSTGKLGALGGNSLTVEENYLFQKLMREGGGTNNIDHRVGMPIISLEAEGVSAGMEISIGECEDLSYAILLGVDLTEEFPVIWLRLKQAINRGAKVVFIGHYAPEIAPQLSKTILHRPGLERETLTQQLPDILNLSKEGKKGALFVGSQYLNTPHRKRILIDLFKIKKDTPNLSVSILEGRGNSMGARFAGMRPDFGPLGTPLSTPGLNALQMIEKAAESGWNFLYVAGANPAMKFASKLWTEMRSKLGFLVVQDLFLTETAKQADLVLPVLSFIEKGGSFLNIEGRAQKLLPGKAVPEEIFSDGEIFMRLAQKLNISSSIDSAFLDRLKKMVPGCQSFKFENQDEAISSENPSALFATFAPELFDNGVRMKHDLHLIQLAKEPRVRIHPSDAAKRGVQDGDIIQLSANGNRIQGQVKVDKRIAEQTIVLPLGFEEKIPVYDLARNLVNGMSIEIEK